MATQDLRFEITDGVAEITLQRPEERNAVTGAMLGALGDAYRECDCSDEIRAVVLTGSGDSFCAGADMSAGDETFARRDEDDFSAGGADIAAFEVRKPVIAAVNGHAIGIGLSLALQCDLRILAREGRYGIVQVRRGVMPDAYSHYTLPRIIGFERAADLLLTGRKIDGDEAKRIGLASRVLPAEEVLSAARRLAREIAETTAPLSVALTKRLLWAGMDLDWKSVGRRETELHHHLMGRPDAIEGVRAFLERRPPRFSASASRDWPEWPDD